MAAARKTKSTRKVAKKAKKASRKRSARPLFGQKGSGAEMSKAGVAALEKKYKAVKADYHALGEKVFKAKARLGLH